MPCTYLKNQGENEWEGGCMKVPGYESLEKHEIFLDLLYEVYQGMNKLVMDVFKQLNVTMDNMVIIGKIKREPGIILSELARRTDNAKSHVSRTVEEFIQRGWIEKRYDPNNNRVIRLFLTEIAIENINEIRIRLKDQMNGIVNMFSETQIIEIIKNLSEIKEAIHR